MYISCEKCKYNYDGECDFYAMGSGDEIDMPCYQEEELIEEAADNFLQAFVDVDINEVESKIVKTEEPQENGVKYLNINVSDSEVERDPDILRLCADVGILEYMKPKTGHWINAKVGKLFPSNDFKCSECGNILDFNGVNCGRGDANFCPNCGAKMVDIQEESDIE